MQYDPIKHILGRVFNRYVFTRKIFYFLLDLLLLRSWHIHRFLKSFSSEVKDQPIKVLDAGFGFGQYSWYMARKNPHWEICGVEIKAEQVADCNRFFKQAGKNNATFKLADLTQYREAEHYNLIVSVDVMEHIEEDVKVFENFYASLASGGVLLVSTPSDQGGSDVHQPGETSFIEEHVRDGYNNKELEQKLRDAGFSKIYVRYSYGKPGRLSWLLSMKFPIQMLGFSKLFFVVLPFYYLLTFPFCLVLNYFDVRWLHKKGTGLIVQAYK